MNPSYFLQHMRVDPNTWELAAIDWTVLEQIAEDHKKNADALQNTAELLARTIQKFPDVHSVRWRVKDADHLLEKIVRKRAEKNEKYLSINAENYFEIVTDLVGVRALHLFKEECFPIGDKISSTWTANETPVAYVRTGDPQDLSERFSEAGYLVKEHPAGYRSVHFVVSTRPMQRQVLCELQVRTIFEEGWSEIDHRVRYPNFSEDRLVAYFLTIFNRLAGSADEMGTFVQGLVSSISRSAQTLNEERTEKGEVVKAMEELLGQLEQSKKQDNQSQAQIRALQEEVKKLKAQNAVKLFDMETNRTGAPTLFPIPPDSSIFSSSSIGLGAASRLLDEDEKRRKAIEKLFKPKP